MIIQIDTNNLSTGDRALLTMVLHSGMPEGQVRAREIHVDVPASSESKTEESAKPAGTRGRRNKQQIAYDDALAAFQGPNKGDGSEYTALVEAAKALEARDPDDERLSRHVQIVAEVEQDEPATEDVAKVTDEEPAAEAEDNPLGEFKPVTIEQLTTLASELISADRPAMIEILKGFGVRRVSEVPEAKYGELAATIRTKLGK